MPRYRIIYSKRGPASYNSHLDLVRTIERAMRRAGLPMAFSEGFNPHPRLSFAAPLPVGTEGLAEVVDVEMKHSIQCKDLADRLNSVLPPGLAVKNVNEVADNSAAPMAVLDSASYIVHLDSDDLSAPVSEDDVEKFLAQENIEVARKGKDGRNKIRNIRPGIIKMKLLSKVSGLTMELVLKTGSVMNVRPEEVLGAFFRYADLSMDISDLQISRTGLFVGDNNLK